MGLVEVRAEEDGLSVRRDARFGAPRLEALGPVREPFPHTLERLELRCLGVDQDPAGPPIHQDGHAAFDVVQLRTDAHDRWDAHRPGEDRAVRRAGATDRDHALYGGRVQTDREARSQFIDEQDHRLVGELEPIILLAGQP